jgi:hypothetical protein
MTSTAAAAQQITTEVANGFKYLSTVYRGTQYTLHQGRFGWELSTRRIGYGGRFHLGGFKRFDSIAAVAAGCKTFGPAETIAAFAYGI